MEQSTEEKVKRWMAKHKAVLVLESIKSQTTVSGRAVRTTWCRRRSRAGY